MTHQVRHVRTRAGAQRFDQPIGEVIREKSDRDVAKDQWRDAGMQLAIASGSLVTTGLLLMRVTSGLIATILVILLLLIGTVLGVLSLALRNSRAKRTTRKVGRTARRSATRTVRHTYKRAPARSTTRRRR